ncbi:MAG: gliding motility-associated C-terminal domain-containing protein [Bacteroidetes bacterium]|nr:gliding motility-associated C-terminal domain-containing protein [Bacteroidota bacterium]
MLPALKWTFALLLIVFAPAITMAQLCNGSLGDPVVNITFGSGASNGGFATDAYTYTSSTCPNDGYYTITNQTAGCFGNHWHTITADHTGNGGNFMLVNASLTPGDFVKTNVDNLCPNTTYEFAAWIMNVLNFSGIRPNITFTIETSTGTVLQQYSTGDILETPTPIWRQYGFFFTTPATNTPIVLRMTNNAPGGNGNDLALDDITFRPCGSIKLTSSIQNNTDTVNICEGITTTYTLNTAVTGGTYASPAYQWQVSTDSGATWKDIAGATTFTYIRASTGAGAYWYRLTVAEQSALGIAACRIGSNIVAINVHGKPLVDAGTNRVLYAGKTITLNGSVSGEQPTYYWDPPAYLSDYHLLNAVATPPVDITYALNAESAYGCTASDVMSIKVVAGIFVPNAFTPNNDGKNDHWRIPFLDPGLDAAVSVYDRWGRLVYYNRGGTVDWDGTYKNEPAEAGTYVYSIHFNIPDFADMKGTLVLIR